MKDGDGDGDVERECVYVYVCVCRQTDYSYGGHCPFAKLTTYGLWRCCDLGGGVIAGC